MKLSDIIVCHPKTPDKDQTVDIEIISKTGVIYLLQLDKYHAISIAMEIETEFYKRKG